MNWNCDHFSKWNAKFGKTCTLKKFIVIQWRLIQKMWCIGEIIIILNKKLQNILFENSFLCKSEKDQKRIHNPFTK
jgi:hypothetical protein